MRQVSEHPAGRYFVPTSHGPLAVLRAEASQQRPDRPAVLMVPGFTGSKEDFAPLLGPVSAVGREAVAMDQRGQHESPGPEHPGPYTMTELATDVLRVADHLQLDRPHLVGHSFGGLVARAAVLASPDRFRSLTLMDSGPSALGGPRAERLALLAPALDAVGIHGVYEAMEAMAPHDPHYVEPGPDLKEFLRKRFLAQSETGLREMGRQLQEEPDRVAELAALGLPTFVLFGARDDAWSPAEQAEMARRLGARHEVVPQAFHSPAVENPRITFAALQSFWRGVDRPR